MLKNLKSKKSGFTLAEILISLAIVGVVAAITIPTMMRSIDYEDKYIISAYQKVFATLDEAATNILTYDTNGSYTLKNQIGSTGTAAREKFEKYIHFTSASGAVGTAPDGAVYTFGTPNTTCTLAATSITSPHATAPSTTDGPTKSVSNGCVSVEVDVNGPKSPNTAKRDKHTFVIGPNGLKTSAS